MRHKQCMIARNLYGLCNCPVEDRRQLQPDIHIDNIVYGIKLDVKEWRSNND